MKKHSERPLPFMKSRRRKGKQLSFSFLKQKCLSPLLKQVEEHCLSCPERVDRFHVWVWGGLWQAGQFVLCLKVSAYVFINLNQAGSPAHPPPCKLGRRGMQAMGAPDHQ